MLDATNQPSSTDAVTCFNRACYALDLATDDLGTAKLIFNGGRGPLSESQLREVSDRVSVAVDLAFDAAVLAFPALATAPNDYRHQRITTIKLARKLVGAI